MSMHVGQSEVPPLVAVGQALVIHPQQMKDGGIEVMNVHGSWRPSILAGLRIQRVAVGISNVVTVIIGAAIGDPGTDTTPRHPDGEASRVMIPTIILCGQTSLTIHCSSKFPAPDHEGVLQHAALLEVLDQRC